MVPPFYPSNQQRSGNWLRLCVYLGGSILPAVTAHVIPDNDARRCFRRGLSLRRLFFRRIADGSRLRLRHNCSLFLGKWQPKRAIAAFSSYCLVVVQALYYHGVDFDIAALIVHAHFRRTVSRAVPPSTSLCAGGSAVRRRSVLPAPYLVRTYPSFDSSTEAYMEMIKSREYSQRDVRGACRIHYFDENEKVN